MIACYCVVKRLPWPFHVILPWRVNRLINDTELRVLLQPALCFPAFVDNVVVHDQRDGFRPPVRRFKPLPQADEQR